MRDRSDESLLQECRAREARLLAILDCMNDAIFLHDPATAAIIDVNQCACEMFGYTRDEILKLDIGDISSGESPYTGQHALELFGKTVSGEAQLLEWCARDKTGHLFWVELNMHHMVLAEECYVLVMVRDIFKRKKAEEALLNSQRMLSLVNNSIPQSVFWKDRNSVYLGCNQVFAKAVGLSDPADIVGKTDYDLPWSVDEAEAYRADDREVMENNQPKLHVVEPVQQADGTRIWVDTTKVPLQDRDGNVVGVLGVYDDITERKEADEALHESEERFKRLVEQSPISIQVFDPGGRTIQINKAFEKLWGSSLEDLRNFNILHDEQLTKSGLIAYIKRGFAGEAVSIPAIEYDARDAIGKGYKRWVKAYVYPVNDKQGNIRNVVLMHEDITEIKHAEEEKRAFYRQTILSATDGKLQICDESEIKPYTQAAQVVIDVHESSDVANARREIESVLCCLGMDPEEFRVYTMAVGEAITNGLKHAGWGMIYVGTRDDEVWVAVEDHGHGIDSIILPGAVLRRGFSTKQSMGLGYSIMLDASDRILLSTGSDGTTVVLIKYLHERPLDLQKLPDTWESI